MTGHVDRERTQALAAAIMKSVRDHYLQDGQPSRSRTLEVLNALAASSAVVLIGTGPAPEALEFFRNAVEQNLDEIELPDA